MKLTTVRNTAQATLRCHSYRQLATHLALVFMFIIVYFDKKVMVHKLRNESVTRMKKM